MSWDPTPQILSTSSVIWTPGSDEESSYSTEDEEDIQCQILEKERDEATQKLSEIGQVSTQLLKEMELLEMQFEIERTCRESAEALAVEMTKENKVLKRRSQALLPLIAELPENLDAMTLGLEDDLGPETDPDSSAESILQCQSQIRDLQSSLDQLLGVKMQLSDQVETLKREHAELKEQLAKEIEEKEALLRKLNKQSHTIHKVKRVSQLVSQEFSDITQRLQLEQGLRQHAEVFAQQMLVKQREAQRQSLILMQSAEMDPQLQLALQQVAHISSTQEDIRLQQQNQMMKAQPVPEESSMLSELQSVRAQLEKSEGERREVEIQLSDAQCIVTELQEEVKQLQDRLTEIAEAPPTQTDQPREETSTPAPPRPPPPPPPPPPLPPLFSTAVHPLDALRKRRMNSTSTASTNPIHVEPPPTPAPKCGFTRHAAMPVAVNPRMRQPSSLDVKARAVDEMMERIKKGIVLRSTQRPQQVGSDDDSAWRYQKNEKRKSAVLELQGMLDSMKRPSHRMRPSCKRISRHVGEAELQAVLLRRRRAMGDDQGHKNPMKTQDPQPASPADGTVPRAGESSCTPVLGRLKQNREKRNSRLRASESVTWKDS